VSRSTDSGNSISGDGASTITAEAIAAIVSGELLGDGKVSVSGVAPLDRAQESDLSILSKAKYAPMLAATKAGIVLVDPEFRDVAGRLGRVVELTVDGGDIELDRAILDATRRELRRVQGHVMLLGKKGAREKVAAFLLGLAEHEQFGGVDLPMGRQDMADYLGLTIETVSRMLTQLQSDNVVQFPSSRRFRVTQRYALEAIAE